MIKKLLKKIGPLYDFLRKLKKHYQLKIRTRGKYKFENRKKNHKKMCIVLAGYKDFLYEDLFKRISTFELKDMDICLVSSGKYSKKLSNIAKENQWSYLSISENCIPLALNIAIMKFPKADLIYKIDEDIFVTKNFFGQLLNTYNDVVANGDYIPGMIAPIIPINGYGHVRVLEKLNLKEKYEEKFESVRYAAGPDRKVENDLEVAKFFWGEGNYVPQIDELDKRFAEEKFSYKACPIRFSIGAILFARQVWEDMGLFMVKRGSPCLGLDEEQLCSFCMNRSRAIIVSENTVVGHLSFGRQNEGMKDYFEKNRKKFSIQ